MPVSHSSLLDVSDSLLIAIDIQPSFVKKESEDGSKSLLQRMRWVIKVANWLKVPLVVTAEDIPNNGSVSDEVMELLPPDTKTFNKMTFGLTEQADILKAVHQTRRKTAVLIGYKTDVCITHSALGLVDLGRKVAVVSDATSSPAMPTKLAWAVSVLLAGLSSAQRVCIMSGCVLWKKQTNSKLWEARRLRGLFCN